jgi:hypothetical protein
MKYWKDGDHIPWVYTRGIYGDPDFERFEGDVLLVYLGPARRPGFHMLPNEYISFCESLAGIGKGFSFKIAPWMSVEYNKLNPYMKRYPNAQALVFNRNGSLGFVFFEGQDPNDKKEDIERMITLDAELRHVGNEFHYPDWRFQEAVDNRPLTWAHLYMGSQFTDEHPPNREVLLQAILDCVSAAMFDMDDEARELFMTETLESLQTLYDRRSHTRYWDD